MADHIPDPGKHRTHFYGFYASQVRASRRETEASDVPTEPTTKRRCPPSWARLISKVYHADPLVCRQCGGKLKVVAYVSDEISVKRILTELGLSPPEDERGARSRSAEDNTFDSQLRQPASIMIPAPQGA